MVIRKILVALDDSPRAERVFDAAAEIACRFAAPIVMLSVIDVPPEFPAAAAGSPRDELPELLTAQALARLQAIAQTDARVSVEATLVRTGQPWREILRVADEVGADLTIVGSHGYHGLDRVLGTTAGKVANRSHCNVLVVHGTD